MIRCTEKSRIYEIFNYLILKVNIGYGKECCSFFPFTQSLSLQCCNQKVISTKLINPYSRNVPAAAYIDKDLYFNNSCFQKNYEPIEEKRCKDFEQVYSHGLLSVLDQNLTSFTSYDYKICVKNTFDKTCNDKVFSAQTEITLPRNFSYFNYKILHENELLLYWNEPIQINGPLEYYVLYRNEIEIYRGKILFFFDENYEILQPFKMYRYELKVCNTFGCTYNDKILYASTKEKLPKSFDLPEFKVFTDSIQMLWKMPPAVNGVLKSFLINIKEIDLEVSIYFDFNSEKLADTISVKNISNSTQFLLYYSADSIYFKQTMFNLTFIDLRPYTNYSLQLSVCNSIGCNVASSNFNYNVEKFTTLLTNEYNLDDFSDPVIYVMDESTLELVWQPPNVINGILTSFKIFRNNLFLTEFDLTQNYSDLKYEMGFYSYIEYDLIPDTFYSYRISASNKNFTILSKEVFVETPSLGFIKQCNVSENSTVFEKNSQSDSDLLLLNIVNFQFFVNSSTDIIVSYDVSDWKKLITCISLFNYNNMQFSSLDEINSKYQSDDKAFTIKILLQSNVNGLQSIDFPYPDNLNLENNLFYTISGLLPFTNYSIRIAFSTFYPNKQLLTTNPVFLQTKETQPCCDFKKPIVMQFPFMKTFSVRFKIPIYPNGIINNFTIQRAKLIGKGCLYYDSTFNMNDIEEIKELNITNTYNDQFLFDITNSDFIYKDLDESLIDQFSYFSYKIKLYNSECKYINKFINKSFY